jgi:rare lipoprotein A
MLRFLIALGVVTFVAMSPPSQAREPTYMPAYARQKQVTKVGIASWYGEDFQGSQTASGEPYDMNALTGDQSSKPPVSCPAN